ncbi:uncharacterized protein LOC110007732 [Amborella trichopoda]|uniref:uncharacterized protein LOC110007732 n=1 Tax=Amborella trichopoda TaxID=13333 RepID=UPI0009BEB1A8|nr:uncharacterized protein LOC110007732 [Amborella trichopoda]|eukprot:XP_020526202.1 uncharacterized protein LOC110007732 [Amborella trichopoda]
MEIPKDWILNDFSRIQFGGFSTLGVGDRARPPLSPNINSLKATGCCPEISLGGESLPCQLNLRGEDILVQVAAAFILHDSPVFGKSGDSKRGSSFLVSPSSSMVSLVYLFTHQKVVGYAWCFVLILSFFTSKMHPLLFRLAAAKKSRLRFDPLLINPLAIVVVEPKEPKLLLKNVDTVTEALEMAALGMQVVVSLDARPEEP